MTAKKTTTKKGRRPAAKGLARKNAGFASARARKMAEIMAKNPSIKPYDAMVQAGYSPNSNPYDVIKSQSYRLAHIDIDAQRKQLRQMPGCSLTDSVAYYADIAHRSRTDNPDTGIRAMTRLDKLLGNEAPVKQEIRSMGLVVELGQLTAEELEAIAAGEAAEA